MVSDCERFKDYYYKYLNFDGKENIVCSEERDKKVNIFYYPIIVSFYDNKVIYSISEKYYDDLKEILKNKDLKNEENIIFFLSKYFKKIGKDVDIQKMYRMTKKQDIDVDISKVVKIDENVKKEYFNSFEHHNDMKYKEEKWNKIKNMMYLNGVIENGRIVSLGFVSNIDYEAANIVVQTNEKYQNKGYGKNIVKKISRDLLDDILPIYWVNAENKPSIKLAKDIGFEEKSIEIVVKYKK